MMTMPPSYKTPSLSLVHSAMKGLTLRLQMRPGAPDDTDDPMASTVVVDGPDDGSISGDMALDDMDFDERGGPSDMDSDDGASLTPQIDRVNANSTNRTGFIDNNYPISQQVTSADDAAAAAGLPPDLSGMIASPMAAGRPDPRKRAIPGIMAGLGLR